MIAKPKIIWNYSLKTEAERIVFTAHPMAAGFYQDNGFLVLSYPAKSGGTVYFPHLKLSPDFWAKAKKLRFQGVPNNKKLVEMAENSLRQNNFQLTDKPAKKMRIWWEKKEANFWPTVIKILPQLETKIKIIEIRPTKFGTLSSYSSVHLPEGKVYLFIRLDKGPDYIAEAILSSLLDPLFKQGRYQWREREAVIDFLITQTELKRIFPNYRRTLAWIDRKDNSEMALHSQEYLKELGLLPKNNFSPAAVSSKLNPVENEILKLLYRHKNKLCSLDLIAETIWKEDALTKFSPWAIAKIIERLRKKIALSGFNPALIQAKRKEGYVFIG